MTTYSEKPLRIVGLTVLLSIDEHIVPFCPQKVYKKYTSSIHQLTTAAPAAPEPPAAAAKSGTGAQEGTRGQEEQTRNAECVICLSESRRFKNEKTDLSVGSQGSIPPEQNMFSLENSELAYYALPRIEVLPDA